MTEEAQKTLWQFRVSLIEAEKALSTVRKYTADAKAYLTWSAGQPQNRETVLAYKSRLSEKYAPAAVNAALCSLNAYFAFIGRYDCRVKLLRLQKQLFAGAEKELTREEYERLLNAAKQRKKERLYLAMQTLCACGIRVSELRYITTQAVKEQKAVIDCKGKRRVILLPRALCGLLKTYAKKKKLTGCIFVTRSGKPLDRSNLWSEMKKLCEAARVAKDKVFPHNLRHLFARTFYQKEKDIVRLADILGHSSVNTTRIYTMETGEEHRRKLEQLHLVMRC